MTLYLHAGLPKTGSSSIQEIMAAGRHRLRGAGVRYWNYAARHTRPLRILFGEDSLTAEARAVRVAKYGEAETIRASLETFFAKSGNLLISGEGISVFSEEALRGLKNMSGRDVKVIVYVREPRSWFASGIQQVIKTGATLEQAVEARTGYNRLRRLTDVFGKAVQARLYKSSPDGKALIQDFLSALNLAPDLLDEHIEAPLNTSLSDRSVWLIEAINRMSVGGGTAGKNGALLQAASTMPGKPFKLPAGIMNDLLTRFADDIAFASEMVGVDLLRLGEESDSEKIEFEPGIVETVYRLKNRMNEETAKRCRAEGLLAEAQGRQAEARVCYMQALVNWPDYEKAKDEVRRLDGGDVDTGRVRRDAGGMGQRGNRNRGHRKQPRAEPA